jgi:hypothetical protein
MFGLAIAVALALAAFWAGAATGTVVLQEQYSGTYSDSFDDCGFTLEVEGTFSGQFTIRADRDGEAFYARDTGSFREVLTNAETGEWFVVRGHRVFHEVKATLVNGTVYEFEQVEAGQPFVIEDSAGNVVVRDRGVIRFGALFDTLGDGEPGVVFLAETYTSVRGPHPGFAEDFPFCEIAAELTGA